MNAADRLALIEHASARLTFWSQVLADVLEDRDPGVRTPEQSLQTRRDREVKLLEGDFHTYARQDRHRKPARPDFGGAA